MTELPGTDDEACTAPALSDPPRPALSHTSEKKLLSSAGQLELWRCVGEAPAGKSRNKRLQMRWALVPEVAPANRACGARSYPDGCAPRPTLAAPPMQNHAATEPSAGLGPFGGW